MIEIIHGDCLEEMKKMPDNSVDSIVTDPPYGLSFMGKKWDYDVPSQEIWEECLRVLKPGGYLLSFAGTRTQHRMAVRIEDAGFEIRDMIAWVYGSGFPKSLNIGKAVDKLQGNERESFEDPRWKEKYPNGNNKTLVKSEMVAQATRSDRPLMTSKGTSPHEGWGTALKPALEPITVARKPLSEKTVAENVLTHGTGGLNIDGCRVEGVTKHNNANGVFAHSGNGKEQERHVMKNYTETFESTKGRFPANLIHDGSEEVMGLFPSNVKGEIGRAGRKSAGDYEASNYKVGVVTETGFKDSGSAARFFYCAKASKKDRDEGLEGFEAKSGDTWGSGIGHASGDDVQRRNNHPTVKPTELMRYLCRLVTPKGGTILDPFMGSGSTGKAARLEGFDFIGIELDEDYYKIAQKRIHDSSN